ncbi:nucleolar protein 14 [Strongylocentrotus purpuratus]|uniref:Nucleolar protein 14 n=1 Tax=Strongylocentrotus purpuratus TaxID=7668 RepID=A0A7M7NSQ5_STRPU|nr:nucleolar protein 14 [Strongylocentrotus purpuratus]
MAKNKKRRSLTSKVEQRSKATEIKNNPFEVKINKQKHNILGRKNKHGKGVPVVSRSKGLQKRNATLLQEYKQRHKSNKFLDKRLGENDPEMSVEDKMMERFTLEKQRNHEKSGMYSLNTDEDLTHYGQSLSSLEKFEEPDLASDDEEGGMIDKKFVAEEHFGGFLTKKKTDEEGKPKTRQEIFEEIIAKSKKDKFNRQSEKEDVVKLTEQLDQDFNDVSQFLAKVKRDKDEERRKPDDYDMSVKELIFDMRAKASDRLKTPEELAKEEKEKLEKMETDRQRRMKGITETEEQENKRRMQYLSADDLNDGFELTRDNRSTLSYRDGVPSFGFDQGESDSEEKEEEGEEEVQEDDEEEEEDDESEEGEEEEEDNASDLDSETDEDDDEDDRTVKEIKSSLKKGNKQSVTKKVSIQEPVEKKKKIEEMMRLAKEELPYTFKAPTCLEELEGVLTGHSPSNQLTIIERMIKCHHPSLSDGNKAKLETLTTCIYQLMGKYVKEGKDLQPQFINGLTKHLYDLTQTCALASGNSLMGIICEKYESFNKETEDRGRSTFPSLDVLLYFKLVSALFPTSDFRHSVVTPTMLFMGAILSQCQVRSCQDVTFGLFICNLFLKNVSLSKRLVPEVMNFLQGILYMASDHESKTAGLVVAPFKQSGRFSKLLRHEGTSEAQLRPVKILDLVTDLEDLDQAEFSTWALGLTCHLLHQFSTLYVDLPSYSEIFSPIYILLQDKELLLNKYHHDVQSLGDEVLSHIEGSRQRTRRVLEVEKKKPAPLKMFEPKIEENYDPTRKYRSSGNKEHDEQQRLKHRHRREMKGAVREIRKDTQFIARQKLKEQKERDDERKEKVMRLHQMLATQEGDFRDIKRKKRKP